MCLKIRSWGVFVFFCFISSYKVFSQGTCDFGNLRSYNVISNTGATIWNSDIEGTSAYGGNLQSGNFSYGQTLPANSSPALQVQGDITVPGASNNIQVFNGNVTITGNVNGGGSVITNGYALQTGQPSIPLNIPSAFTLLQNRASTWSGIAATGSVSINSGIVTLNGNNASGVVVFNLTAGTHTSTSSFNTGIYNYNFINCSNASTVLVNVSGTNVKFFGGLTTGYPSPNLLLWNFYQATYLEIGNWGFKGTTLAPYAYLNLNSAHIDGQVFVNFMNGSNGEVHNRNFLGKIGTSCPPTYTFQGAVCNTTTPCSGGLDAMTMPGFYNNGTAGANYVLLNGTFTEYADGTAYFFGRVQNANDPNILYDVSFTFNGKTSTPGPGNPWNPNGCTPSNSSGWIYYTGMGGSFVGISNTPTDGVIGFFTKTGTQHVQLGLGANGSQATLFGLGATFSGQVVVSNGRPVASFSGGVMDWVYCTQPVVCDNVTSAGLIGANQGSCIAPFNPVLLTQTTAPSGGTGTLEYQWQISPNNSTWTDIAGATSVTYDPPAISTSQYYRRNVRRSNCTTYLNSNVVSVLIQSVNLSVTATSNGPLCVGGNLQLGGSVSNGNAPYTYVWSGPSSFSSNIQNPTRTSVQLSHAGNYNLTVTDAFGCTGTATTPLTINASSTAIIASNLTQVCEGGSVILTVTTAGGAGNCIIQWQSSPNGSTWTNISGANSTTYTTPALSSGTQYRVVYTCDGVGCCN